MVENEVKKCGSEVYFGGFGVGNDGWTVGFCGLVDGNGGLRGVI